jgi:hypothetical protein
MIVSVLFKNALIKEEVFISMQINKVAMEIDFTTMGLLSLPPTDVSWLKDHNSHCLKWYAFYLSID